MRWYRADQQNTGFHDRIAEAALGSRGILLENQDVGRDVQRRMGKPVRRLRALLHGDPPDEDVRRWRAEFSAVLADVGSAPPAVPSLVHMHANRLGLTRSEEYRVIHRLYEVGKDILHRTAAP